MGRSRPLSARTSLGFALHINCKGRHHTRLHTRVSSVVVGSSMTRANGYIAVMGGRDADVRGRSLVLQFLRGCSSLLIGGGE